MKKHRLWRRRFVERSLARGMPRDGINHALMVAEVLRAVESYHDSRSFRESLSRFYEPLIRRILTQKVRWMSYLSKRAQPVDQRQNWPNIIVRRK